MAKIFITHHFFRQAKQLKKKCPHLKEDLINALKKFNPQTETSLGRSLFKIRIASQDIPKGKSGGLRCYVYLYRKKDLVVPISVYFKGQKENLGQNEVEYHLRKTLEEVLGDLN